jgi:deferrochelatase/peroxidase EfeB
MVSFKDGTMNPLTSDPKLMDQFIWVGDEGG